jgi:hypothetical protein
MNEKEGVAPCICLYPLRQIGENVTKICFEKNSVSRELIPGMRGNLRRSAGSAARDWQFGERKGVFIHVFSSQPGRRQKPRELKHLARTRAIGHQNDKTQVVIASWKVADNAPKAAFTTNVF